MPKYRIGIFVIWCFQVLLCDPGCFRELDELVRAETRGRGQMEVLSLKEVEDREERIEWTYPHIPGFYCQRECWVFTETWVWLFSWRPNISVVRARTVISALVHIITLITTCARARTTELSNVLKVHRLILSCLWNTLLWVYLQYSCFKNYWPQ